MGELPAGPALAWLPYWKRDLFKHYPFCPLLVTAGWSKASMWGAAIQRKKRKGGFFVLFFCYRLSLPASTQNTKRDCTKLDLYLPFTISDYNQCPMGCPVFDRPFWWLCSFFREVYFVSLSEIKWFYHIPCEKKIFGILLKMQLITEIINFLKNKLNVMFSDT